MRHPIPARVPQYYYHSRLEKYTTRCTEQATVPSRKQRFVDRKDPGPGHVKKKIDELSLTDDVIEKFLLTGYRQQKKQADLRTS